MPAGTLVGLPNLEELLLSLLSAKEPEVSLCFIQRRAVEGGILILGRRAIEPMEVPFFLRSKASKNRVRVIVSYSRLRRVFRGVDSGIFVNFVDFLRGGVEALWPLRSEFRHLVWLGLDGFVMVVRTGMLCHGVSS